MAFKAKMVADTGRYREIQVIEEFYSGFQQVRATYDVEIRVDLLIITDKTGAYHIISRWNIDNGIHDMIEDSGYFSEEYVDEVADAMSETLKTLK